MTQITHRGFKLAKGASGWSAAGYRTILGPYGSVEVLKEAVNQHLDVGPRPAAKTEFTPTRLGGPASQLHQPTPFARELYADFKDKVRRGHIQIVEEGREPTMREWLRNPLNVAGVVAFYGFLTGLIAWLAFVMGRA